MLLVSGSATGGMVDFLTVMRFFFSEPHALVPLLLPVEEGAGLDLVLLGVDLVPLGVAGVEEAGSESSSSPSSVESVEPPPAANLTRPGPGKEYFALVLKTYANDKRKAMWADLD